MLRRVIRETVVGALGSPRAADAGGAPGGVRRLLRAHRRRWTSPTRACARTAQVMDLVAWGRARRPTRRRAGCARCTRSVRGELAEQAGRWPAGTPYAADDPELLLWILATLMDSASLVYGRYVARLSRAERDALWTDYRVVGRLFGLADDEMPATTTAFRAYMREMLPRATWT